VVHWTVVERGGAGLRHDLDAADLAHLGRPHLRLGPKHPIRALATLDDQKTAFAAAAA